MAGVSIDVHLRDTALTAEHRYTFNSYFSHYFRTFKLRSDDGFEVTFFNPTVADLTNVVDTLAEMRDEMLAEQQRNEQPAPEPALAAAGGK
jgi:hypothetical protein